MNQIGSVTEALGCEAYSFEFDVCNLYILSKVFQIATPFLPALSFECNFALAAEELSRVEPKAHSHLAHNDLYCRPLRQPIFRCLLAGA